MIGTPEEPLLLRAEEVANLLGLGRTKIFQMLAAGELPALRIGRCVRVPRADLEAWVRSRTARRSQLGLDGAMPGHEHP